MSASKRGKGAEAEILEDSEKGQGANLGTGKKRRAYEKRCGVKKRKNQERKERCEAGMWGGKERLVENDSLQTAKKRRKKHSHQRKRLSQIKKKRKRRMRGKKNRRRSQVFF